MRRIVTTLLLLISFGLLSPPSVARSDTSRDLPDKFERSPYSLMSLSVGHPNHGWQLRAKRLRNTHELKVRPSSRRKNYAHPALVLMLRRSATDVAKAVPGSVMLVGDLSYKKGGPIAGHHSHQSGRDADVAFYMKDARGRPFLAKHFVHFDPEGKAKDGSGLQFDDYRNWLLVESWAKDRRAGLSHIFVSSGLRKRLLTYANKKAEYRKYRTRAAALLKQPEVGELHDDHFHVRIACPARQHEICRAESL